MTDIAAERFSRRIVRGAFLAAIQIGDGGIETGIQGADIFGIQVGGRAQYAIWNWDAGIILS